MLKIDLGIMNGGMLRLSIKGADNQTRFGITDLMLRRFGAIRLKLFEFEEDKRRLTFELGNEGNSLCDAKGRVLHGNELRTTIEPSAHGLRLVPDNASMATYEAVERHPGRWSVILPKEWVIPQTDNLLSFADQPDEGVAIEGSGVNVRTPTTDVLSGKVRIPSELANKLVGEVGAGQPVSMQFVDRGHEIVLSPRVWKGVEPHTRFTTGHNPRPKIPNIEDGIYGYSLVYSHATAWALTLCKAPS